MNKTIQQFLMKYEHYKKCLNNYNYYPIQSFEHITVNQYSSSYKNISMVDYIQYIDQSKHMIGIENYTLVMNDYYLKHTWWKQQYTKATYYRKRKIAYQSFINYMNNYIEIDN